MGGAGLRRRDGSCGAQADAGARSVVAPPHVVAVVARPEDCTACGLCVDVCPRGAITVDDVAMVDAACCNGCGLCVDECPNGVFELQGR
jgi:ferredoxin